MDKKYVYAFEDGNMEIKDLLGGKGAGLAEMTKIGLPVPPGFTITTEACNEFYVQGEKLPKGLEEQIMFYLRNLEDKTGKKFGSTDNPLLVSVRSGAVISMPGMMDTILNLGLNDQTVKGVIVQTGDERFAFDCYRRFIQMFSNVVLRIEHYLFEEILEKFKKERKVKYDTELDVSALQGVVEEYKKLVKQQTGKGFPQDPLKQLVLAVNAVFASWNNQRAIIYRQINKIPDHLGTAVNIQSMVFGNAGNTSGTGVAFTRNPSNGENILYGEYLVNAQGEDVVAGIRTPQPILKLKEEMPSVFEQFMEISNLLEHHYRDVQDIEFTIEKGKLYLLQTRSGKRTAAAAVKIAVDLVKEGIITKEEALLRVEPGQLDQLLHRRLDPNANVEVIAKGLPASPGAAAGLVVFDADEAEAMGKQGEKVVLVRTETVPDDIHGIISAQGVLTSRGGMTSHAAVVARGMGKPCVCGCEAVKINYPQKEFAVGSLVVKEGDFITIDGTTGQVILGEVPTIDPDLSPEFQELLCWTDQVRSLGIRTNADTPQDAQKAREFGAEGIGLCRTEHMFMDPKRLPIVQKMILAETLEEREAALEQLLPMQREDFKGILAAMAGLPVTIRLLDPPLHEFLPNQEDLLVELTKLKLQNGNPQEIEEKETLLRKVKALSEFNPMLGHRGCRLGIVYPEIYRMQVKAIAQAVVELVQEGYDVKPEIMIPLVIHANELEIMRQLTKETADQVFKDAGIKIDYLIGTMIETPRACITADEIAQFADFFSFGTNDLTQTTLGFSRDDAEGKFLPYYLNNKILADNPFAVIDQKGVGGLVRMAVAKGRQSKTELKIGICGEHGGEPSSVEFCHLVGLNYVSCSPFRVPIARLAAAQAALRSVR